MSTGSAAPYPEPVAPVRRGLGLSALAVGILVAIVSVATIGWILVWAYGAGMGGFAVMGILPVMGPIVGVLAAAGVVLGVVGMVLSRPRRAAVVGLLLSLTPLLVALVLSVVALATS